MSYNMDRIFHIPVSAEFTLDIFVTQQAHLRRQFLAVDAEQASVKRDRR